MEDDACHAWLPLTGKEYKQEETVLWYKMKLLLYVMGAIFSIDLMQYN
jgi:hypothetical protein